MVVKRLSDSVTELEHALATVIEKNIDLNKKPSTSIIRDFRNNKEASYTNTVNRSFKNIENRIWDIIKYSSIESNKAKILRILFLSEELNKHYKDKNLKIMLDMLPEMRKLISSLQIPAEPPQLSFSLPKLHQDIAEEVDADVKEIQKCYNAKCYRSVTILCGRILETVLHRKYYETTGVDVLEKNPGIGLGTLIKKLLDKNVKFDPGLTQQIHLINQIRVFSVHKKKDVFYPTKEQAYAMILYTIDTVKKLF